MEKGKVQGRTNAMFFFIMLSSTIFGNFVPSLASSFMRIKRDVRSRDVNLIE